MEITTKEYLIYIDKIAERIAESKDYITALDAATGDGDHWVNMNMGFQALVAERKTLESMQFSDMFRFIEMSLMNHIGGSSGVLYGSAYLAAAKVCQGQETMGLSLLSEVMAAMLDAIMRRGNSAPGQKTMVDALAPAVEVFQQGLADGTDERTLLKKIAEAATDGANHTKEMAAVRGRAYYQKDKGIGHLDPGAVTMAYQIDTLMHCLLQSFS